MSEVIVHLKREDFRQGLRKKGLNELFNTKRKAWNPKIPYNQKYDYVIKGPIHESVSDDKLYLRRLKFWLEFKRLDYKEFRHRFAYRPEVLDPIDKIFSQELEDQQISLDQCFDIVREAVYHLKVRSNGDKVFPKKKSKYSKLEKEV